MKQCLKITIAGKIQGVGYRKFIQEKAHSFKIEGTIQNLDDGNVVIYACGASENLDRLLDILYNGPKGAHVTHVAVEPFVAQKDFRGVFRIIGL